MPRMGGPYLKAALPELLSPLQGPSTCTVYLLEATTLLPIEPLVDLLPAISPARQSLDVVLSSQKSKRYSVTREPIQDGTTATTNVARELDTLTVSGIISAAPMLAIAGALGTLLTLATRGGASKALALAATVPGGFAPPRRDLMQLQMLELLADRRQIVMVVTPDLTLPHAFIESISRQNGPDVGDGTMVQLGFVEARIVSPAFAAAINDASEILGGKTSTVDAGGQPASAAQAPAGLGSGQG